MVAVTLWLAAGLLCVAVVIPLLAALRPTGSEDGRLSFDLAVYRDQLGELERDRAAGLVQPGEAAAARLEIERRMLAAEAMAGSTAPQAQGSSSSGLTALGLAVALPGAALFLYLQIGAPNAPDQPLRSRPERAMLAPDGSLDLDKAAAALRRRLATSPSSIDGWVLLARTEGARGRWPEAHDAFDHALALVPPAESGLRAEILGAYGELLVGEAKGNVTGPAKADFEQVVAADPKDVRARYFLGLAALQAGDRAAALATWQKLAADSPPDAPLQVTLRQQIAAAGGTASPPVSAAAPSDKPQLSAPLPGSASLPGTPASPMGQAIASLPQDQQNQAIRGMVEGLAGRMEADPGNYEGWMRLGRSWGVLGEARRAADAYARAASLRPDDAPTLQAFADALQRLDPNDSRLPGLQQKLQKLHG